MCIVIANLKANPTWEHDAETKGLWKKAWSLLGKAQRKNRDDLGQAWIERMYTKMEENFT
jgi:hypothetical protein